MKKIYLLLFVMIKSLSAENSSYAFLNKHSQTLNQGDLQFKTGYLKVNDTIDVFNIKEKELGALSSISSIGDMSGYDLELRYGITEHDSIFINYQRWNVEYGGSVLPNNKIEILNRFNFVDSSSSFINSFSFDVGFINDFSENINVTEEAILNPLLHKIKPNSSFSLQNGDIVMGDTTFSLYDKSGTKVTPYVAIEDLDSKSYYGRLWMGKSFSHTAVDLYATVKYTTITSKFALKPDDNALLNKVLPKYTVPDLNRNEMVYNIGTSVISQWGDFIFEFNYEYNYIDRGSELSYAENNHIIEAAISYIVQNNFVVYLGGKAMSSQFNTDIPYLYNTYTQTQYDKKYGFAQVGLIYSFKGFR